MGPKRLSLLEFETWLLRPLGHHGRLVTLLISTISTLIFQSEKFSDIAVLADQTHPDGSTSTRSIMAHRVILYNGSTFFQKIFGDNDLNSISGATVYLRGKKFEHVSFFFFETLAGRLQICANFSINTQLAYKCVLLLKSKFAFTCIFLLNWHNNSSA